MKLRNSLSAALIVGTFTVLAPLYGPAINARAATPQDDLDRNMKTLAGVYSILQQNYADPISSEKAIYQGAIPGHAADAGSAFEFSRSGQNTWICSASSAPSITGSAC